MYSTTRSIENVAKRAHTIMTRLHLYLFVRNHKNICRYLLCMRIDRFSCSCVVVVLILSSLPTFIVGCVYSQAIYTITAVICLCECVATCCWISSKTRFTLPNAHQSKKPRSQTKLKQIEMLQNEIKLTMLLLRRAHC